MFLLILDKIKDGYLSKDVMAGKSIKYYGYDKESYTECLGMIRSSNRNHLMVMNLCFLVVVSLYFLASLLNLFNLSRNDSIMYGSYLLASIVYAFVIGLFPKFSERHSLIFLLINILLMYSYGIFVSALRPYIPGTFYLIVMILTTLSYTDNTIRMFFVTSLLSAIYLWASYRFKTFSIAHIDTFNLVLIQALATGMHYMFHKMRIQQYQLYMKNIQIQKELEVKSSFDTLTGLLNRGRFFSIAEELLKLGDGFHFSIALFDLDGFKEINDTMGHQMGDKVIQIAGRTIIDVLGIGEHYKKSVSEWNLHNVRGLAGRLGGDEFIILYRSKDPEIDTNQILLDILKKLNASDFDGLNKGIKSSVGYTELDENDFDLDKAYKHADDALYEAKKAGKNQIKIYGNDRKSQKRG